MPRFVFPRFSRKAESEGLHPSLIPPGPYDPFAGAAQAPEEIAPATPAPARAGWASDRFTEETTEQEPVAG
jgi:hypothetical protein